MKSTETARQALSRVVGDDVGELYPQYLWTPANPTPIYKGTIKCHGVPYLVLSVLDRFNAKEAPLALRYGFN